jgi:hypothetical protein
MSFEGKDAKKCKKIGNNWTFFSNCDIFNPFHKYARKHKIFYYRRSRQSEEEILVFSLE